VGGGRVFRRWPGGDGVGRNGWVLGWGKPSLNKASFLYANSVIKNKEKSLLPAIVASKLKTGCLASALIPTLPRSETGQRSAGAPRLRVSAGLPVNRRGPAARATGSSGSRNTTSDPPPGVKGRLLPPDHGGHHRIHRERGGNNTVCGGVMIR